MSAFRVFILSGVRPRRAWRFANRIAHEMTGAEICGIVQQVEEKLPLAQRLIANGCTSSENLPAHASVGCKSGLRFRLQAMIGRALFWVHGRPRNLKSTGEFAQRDLEENCAKAGWPFLAAETLREAEVLDLIRQQQAGLVVVLGELSTDPELSAIPLRGLVRVSHDPIKAEGLIAGDDLVIRVEHFISASPSADTVASLKLPVQPQDRFLGMTLKVDLLSDDLLVQTAASLQTGSIIQAARAVSQWIGEILSPYLAQLSRSPAPSAASGPRSRFRPAWKLCLDTLLLLSPWFLVRSWNRRRSRRYPVLILAHHLVSDWPHRMGISTESFWGLVKFLQSHYRIVSFSEAIALLDSGVVDTPTVVLTFDDGYADNFVSLRAVAQEAGIPVTLFIATGPVELRQEFQHDLVHQTRGALPLTWAQIKYWSRRGAEFGSHTRTHFDCGSQQKERLTEEIVFSRNDLERHLDLPVDFFAFPFGQPGNISEESAVIAAAGYKHFVSCYGGENHPDSNGSVPQHLLRKVFYPNAWELELELQSVFDFVDAIKQKLR